jgi:AraC-like DNA-binding protein
MRRPVAARQAAIPGLSGSYVSEIEFAGPLAETSAWPGFGVWMVCEGGNDVRHDRRSREVAGERVLLLRPGDLIWPTRRHGPRTRDLGVVLAPDTYVDDARAPGGRSFHDPNPRDVRLVERLVQLVQATFAGTALESGCAAQALVDHMRGYEGLEAAHAGERAPSARLRWARDYLEAHYARNISLDELATATGLNKSYLVSGFHSAFGLPPHRYQNLVRVARALELLRTGMRIVDVAIATGHADHSHFTRQFRRIMRCSPSEWLRVAAPRRPAR